VGTRTRGPRTGIEVDPAALRQARQNAGLSLAQVAGSDLTRQAVHLIEMGKVRPTLRSLRLIAQRLGVPETALLAPPGPRADQGVIAELESLCQRLEYARAFEHARHLIAMGGSTDRLAFCHHYAGQAAYQLSRPGEALAHLHDARDLFEQLGNGWWAAESMDWEAMVLHLLEDPKALRVGRAALRRYRALDPRRPETEARMLEHLGTISYGRRDYESAQAWYDAALGVEGGVRELARMARIYHGIGMCHREQGRQTAAAELLVKAITLYEAEQRMTSGPMRMGMPMAENDLGLVLMERGELGRAEELFAAAIEHFGAAGIERLQSHVLLSFGELRQRQRRLDDALELTTRGIERAATWNETYALVGGYRQLGELHAERGDHERTDASFQRALLLCEEAGLEERAKECMRAYEQVLSKRREARRRSRSQSA
jgi:tetratricopeptide (TPR) repeat protein